MNLNIKVDTSKFDKAFAEYIKYTKKDLAEIVNTKAYYVARNAVQLTAAVDKEKIESELRSPSKNYPEVPLAAILAAKAQTRERYSKKTGKRLKDKRGLQGGSMKSAMEKIIRVHKNAANFLRSGWIPAIKKLQSIVPSKGGPKYPNIKVKGTDKGGAKASPKQGAWKTSAEIWNSVTGGIKTHNLNKKRNPSLVQSILESGLQSAIDKEMQSMESYIRKKLDKNAERFNKS